MGDYLPDIEFERSVRGQQRPRARDRPHNPRQGIRRQNYNPNNLGPFRIIKDAFVKYIANNLEYYNSIGIRITYMEPDGGLHNIFLEKITETTQITRYETRNDYITMLGGLAENNDNLRFENDQIDEFLNSIRNYRIVEVVLCEEYNGYTIDIKVLYKDNSFFEDGFDPRDELNQQRYLTRSQITNLSRQPPVSNFINLIGLDNPLENRVDRRQRQIQNVVEEQQTRMQNLENPSEEYLDNLLQNWPVEIPQDLVDNGETSNPNQLITINPEDTMDGGMTGQELLSLPVSNHEWGGMCYICHDSDTNGLCRVDCSRGHIFHCECIDMWRNTRLTNQYFNYHWHMDCPMCHELITYKVPLTPDMAASLPSSFGKRCRSCTSRKTCKSCIKKRLSKAKKNIKNIIKGNSFGKKTMGKINSEEKYLRSFI